MRWSHLFPHSCPAIRECVQLGTSGFLLAGGGVLGARAPPSLGMRAAGNQRILAGWWRSFGCSNHTTEYSSSLIVREKLCRIIRKIILLPAECAQVFYQRAVITLCAV
jgi:hypothetical protein